MKLGYIVIDEVHGDSCVVLCRSNDIWKQVPRAGILLRDGRTAKVFATRRDASSAIKRTLTYFKNRDGRRCEYSVRRLEGWLAS